MGGRGLFVALASIWAPPALGAVPITFDARALSEPEGALTVSVPGVGNVGGMGTLALEDGSYRVLTGDQRGTFGDFSVSGGVVTAASGALVVAGPALIGFDRARLTRVTVDPSALGGISVTIAGTSGNFGTPFSAYLPDGNYRLWTADHRGDFGTFTVSGGAVTEVTGLLILTGAVITFDAAQLVTVTIDPSNLGGVAVTIAGVTGNFTTPFSVSLPPGNYRLWTADHRGDFGTFTVTGGAVTEVTGLLILTGALITFDAAQLTAVAIDPTALGGTSVTIAGVTGNFNTPFTVVLPPGNYRIWTSDHRGEFGTFTIAGGAVTGVTGLLVLNGSTITFNTSGLTTVTIDPTALAGISVTIAGVSGNFDTPFTIDLPPGDYRLWTTDHRGEFGTFSVAGGAITGVTGMLIRNGTTITFDATQLTPVTIDPTALGGTSVTIAGVTGNYNTAFTVALPPGNYRLWTSDHRGEFGTFTIAGGAVTEVTGLLVLTGAVITFDATQLTSVTIDPTALAGVSVTIAGVSGNFNTPFTIALPPGNYRLWTTDHRGEFGTFTIAGGVVTEVTGLLILSGGTITFDAARLARVVIDPTNLGGVFVTIAGVSGNYDAPFAIALPPGNYRIWTSDHRGEYGTFTITAGGTLGPLGGALKASGMTVSADLGLCRLAGVSGVPAPGVAWGIDGVVPARAEARTLWLPPGTFSLSYTGGGTALVIGADLAIQAAVSPDVLAIRAAPCRACTPAQEVCNGADDDCDGAVDEGVCPPPPPCVASFEGLPSERCRRTTTVRTVRELRAWLGGARTTNLEVTTGRLALDGAPLAIETSCAVHVEPGATIADAGDVSITASAIVLRGDVRSTGAITLRAGAGVEVRPASDVLTARLVVVSPSITYDGDVRAQMGVAALCGDAITLKPTSTLRADTLHIEARRELSDAADIHTTGPATLRAARYELRPTHAFAVAGLCTLDGTPTRHSRPLQGQCTPGPR